MESPRDRKIREQMEKKLGVEFYTPDELAEETRRRETTNPGTPQISRRITTISDLITQCNEAMAKMSQSNSHKLLIYNCAIALRQLAERLYEFEHPKEVS